MAIFYDAGTSTKVESPIVQFKCSNVNATWRTAVNGDCKLGDVERILTLTTLQYIRILVTWARVIVVSHFSIL